MTRDIKISHVHNGYLYVCVHRYLVKLDTVINRAYRNAKRKIYNDYAAACHFTIRRCVSLCMRDYKRLNIRLSLYKINFRYIYFFLILVLSF